MALYPSPAMVRSATRRRRATWSEDLGNSASAFTLASDKPDAETTDDDKSWSCEGDYRYPLKESLVDPWEQCYGVVYEFDEDMIQGLKDEISNLLVVASLFLAIVTAFVIESAKWLQNEPEQETADLLRQVVQLLSQGNVTNPTVDPLPRFSPDRDFVTINQLWFLSMTQSLAAVVLGTLCLQWLSAFTRKAKIKTHDKALALRQMRYEGFMWWGVPRVPAILLLNVQAALVLYAIGLLWFLFSTNKDVAFPVTIVAGVAILLLVLTTVLPLLQALVAWIYPPSLSIPQCPFKSPISFIIHRSAVLLSIAGSYLVQCFRGKDGRRKVKRWRQEQTPMLTDTLWDYYDELWKRKREDRGRHARAETHESGAHYSHYLAHGLASVMDALIAKPSAVHIVHNCLQDIHGSTAQARTFTKLFRQTFTKDEEDLLGNATISGQDMFALRKDFLSALVLQHLVNHNEKLHRRVLKHRVELFIRVNNSARNHRVEVGRNIKCPVYTQRDALSLAIGIRRQLLECIKNILGDRILCPDELRAVRLTMSSINPDTKVSAHFQNTIRDLAIELETLRVSGRGDVRDYFQTIQAIRGPFPWTAEYSVTEDSPKAEADELQRSHEHVHHQHRYPPEYNRGARHGRGKSESRPLITESENLEEGK